MPKSEGLLAWREEYNAQRPYNSLGYLTLAEFAGQNRAPLLGIIRAWNLSSFGLWDKGFDERWAMVSRGSDLLDVRQACVAYVDGETGQSFDKGVL